MAEDIRYNVICVEWEQATMPAYYLASCTYKSLGSLRVIEITYNIIKHLYYSKIYL